MTQYDPSRATGGYGRGMESDPDDRDPEEIRFEIRQTRTEMSGTIDEIQQRLAPEVLSEQAKDVARDATNQAKEAAQDLVQDTIREVKDAAIEVTEHAVHEVREAARGATVDAKDAAWDATVGRAEDAVSTAGSTAKGIGTMVMDTIRQNPIPAALAGLSLFWLYRNRTSDSTTFGGTGMSGAYRTPGMYQTSRTPQEYPVRTGYASQAERDAMMSETGMPETGRATFGYGYGDQSRRQEGDGGDGMLSSAGQMASDTMSSAGHMASSAGGTALDAGSSIVDIIQQNPVPAALVGIGLGWLYMNRSSGQPDLRAHSGAHYRYSPQATGQAYGSDYGESGGDESTIGRATSRMGEMAGSTQDRVGEMAGSVQEYAGDMAGSVMEQTRKAPSQLQRMMQDNPLMTAALAATLGGVIGFTLPPTQTENRLMGGTRDRVMGRAQEMTSETIEKVQDVAQEVRTTASEQARAQGLTV